MRQERKGTKKGFTKPKSEFGIQHNEKQKARFTYGLTEKQFSNYVKESLLKKSASASAQIFEFLERRLDNVIYRLGLSPTRLGARQMASHGHIMVNGKRVTIPSRRLNMGDKISVRLGSAEKALFKNLDERLKNITVPAWLKFDAGKREAEISGMPTFNSTDQNFNLNSVIEFYSR